LLKDAVALAIESLSWMEIDSLSERSSLMRTSKQLGIRDTDSLKMAHAMIIETTRRLNVIDKVANTILSPQSLEDYTMGVKNFIRLYSYWTWFRKSNVDQAAAFLSVGRDVLGWKELSPVEFALGRILSADINSVLRGSEGSNRIALETFHPSWYVEYCIRLLGRVEALRLLRASNEIPPVYIRANTLVGRESDLVAELAKEGVELEPLGDVSSIYRVLTKKPLTRLEAYEKGLFHIQDLSSCLVAIAAEPSVGDVVLDVCSAPGSKTSHVAQLMKNEGRILALDRSARRIQLWKKEMRRLRVKIGEAIMADAEQPLPLRNAADIVVLDPPCSNTGVFGKSPAAKWNVNMTTIARIAAVQARMIENCGERVRLGGKLLYATCSITTEENELVIERFLKRHPEFKLADTGLKIGLPGLRGQILCRRLYSHLHNCNGFFIAKLEREF